MLLKKDFASDSTISKGGLHQGFDILAWSVVALQIFGGLIVGMVVKYADNILKNFANALSVIFTVLGAMPLFGQYPSGWFIVGVALVSLSVFMYGKSAPQVGPLLLYYSRTLSTDASTVPVTKRVNFLLSIAGIAAAQVVSRLWCHPRSCLDLQDVVRFLERIKPKLSGKPRQGDWRSRKSHLNECCSCSLPLISVGAAAS